MKAVWTTLGCCAAAAAPTAGAVLPLGGEVFSESPFPSLCDGSWNETDWVRSLGGPMVDDEGVMSMGSRDAASLGLDEGRIGIDLCRLGW